MSQYATLPEDTDLSDDFVSSAHFSDKATAATTAKVGEDDESDDTEKKCNCCARCTCEISKKCCSAFFSMNTLLTICGFLFDMFQIALSIADVVTDIMVAIEFKNDGHTPFFALVVATLTITSIVNGCVFIGRLGISPSYPYQNGKAVLLVLVFSAFGLLWPTVNYICTKTGFGLEEDAWTFDEAVAWEEIGDGVKENMENEKKTAKSKNNNNDDSTQKQQQPQSKVTASLNLFLKKVAPEHATLGMLDNAVVERIMSYCIMSTQSLTESVPQVVIQLIAISIFQNVTTLQVISLSLSMFSIVCKAFQLTRSFSTKAFFAKIFYLAHDLFSMAFVFSVLLATNTPRTTNFFFLSDELSPFKINPVSNVWLMIKISNVVIWAILGIWLWIFMFFKENIHWLEYAKGSIAVFLGGAIVIGPALLLHEGAKLSYLILFNATQSPSMKEFPLCSIIHEFLHGGSSSTSLLSFIYDRPVMYPTTDWPESFAALARKIRVVCDDRAKKFDPTTFLDMRQKFTSGKYGMDKEKFMREMAAVEYRTPFLNITVATGKALENSDAFVQVCEKPFTLNSIRRGKNYKPDLRDNYFDHERKGILEEPKAAVVVESTDDKNNNNDTEKDFLIPIGDAAAATGYGSASKADSKAAPFLLDQIETQESLLKKFKKIPDNFVSRARHCIIAAEFHKKMGLASNQPNAVVFKSPAYNLRNFSTFTAGVASLLDPYGEYSVNSFIFEQSARDHFFAKLWEALTEYGLCEDPRPVMAFIVIITFIISSLAGLVFPIVYAALYFDQFALMQKICFYSAMGSLFLGLLLTRAFYWYQLTCMFFKLHSDELDLTTGKLFQIIDTYFSLPLSTLNNVANIREKKITKNNNNNNNNNNGAAIPEDCFEQHVLPFLTTKHFYLYGVLDDEFAKMQESVMKYTALF